MRLIYDKQDYDFLEQVNNTIIQNKENSHIKMPRMHPNGVVVLTSSKELRLASSVLSLLDTLQTRNANERLLALENLHNEVLLTATTTFRYNTARVLIEIMKEIVRSHDDFAKQIRLAHDFRMVAKGNPNLVRTFLKKYYLLEMPEEWNQLVFDHHVHDANTKGRKNPTHLIMDAWIKGIRALTVIYYHFLPKKAASELIRAASIMGIEIRIGILYNLIYRDKLLDFIWIPQKNFLDDQSFLSFLNQPSVVELQQKGEEVSKWKERFILNILDEWNESIRHSMEHEFNIPFEFITKEEFLSFVGFGQSSVLHLAELIYQKFLPALKEKALQLMEERDRQQNEALKIKIKNSIQSLNRLTPEYFFEILEDCEQVQEKYMLREILLDNNSTLPQMLHETPHSLAKHLHNLSHTSLITLNLAHLTPEEVVNLLWDCKGLLTHLEIFNMYDWHNGKLAYTTQIAELIMAINTQNTPNLKLIIQNLIQENQHTIAQFEEEKNISTFFETNHDNNEANDFCSVTLSPKDRVEKLRHILKNIITLVGFYNVRKLLTRMGTDSTSREGRLAGMGLAYFETLSSHAKKEILREKNDSRFLLPARKELKAIVTYRIPYANEQITRIKSILRSTPFLRWLSYQRSVHYAVTNERIQVFNEGKCLEPFGNYSSQSGNIVTLGGIGVRSSNHFCEDLATKQKNLQKEKIHTSPINTNFLNFLKVFIGFVPAFFSFQYTQDVPFLAWSGALIWFLITGFRNIIQAVLGCGGLQRSPLLRWNNYVSWSRLADSLMYTGLSVVLLELIVRNFILQDILGLTSLNAPLITFTIISLLNGIYIVSHNIFRGLPMQAIIGNFFRSFFAIPLALIYNTLFLYFLTTLGVENIDIILLSSSAILSKVASDTIAGIIEGLADRGSNIWRRHFDYELAIQEMYSNYSQLELEFPEENVLEMLKDPNAMLKIIQNKNKKLYRQIIINALDFMYFYYYQPRALSTLKNIVTHLSNTERLSWLRVQSVLTSKKHVSQLLVDGYINAHFSTALTFYLAKHEDYLSEMEKLYKIKK